MAAATIFALASGRPPAAIAIVRVSGPAAHAAGVALCGALPAARCAAVRELRDPEEGGVIDRALVLRFDGPYSSTGEDVVEFHCHGGRAVTDALLGALEAVHGLRLAEPGEFTRRAFENGRIDLTEAEGLADLIAAETETQRRAALRLAEGGLRARIEEWQQHLLALSAQAEAAIDHDEADDEPHSALSSECEALALKLEALLAQPRLEPLKDGVRVVVAGPPNAGKSSLVNCLTGSERAIVTAVPGTTRDHIDVSLALEAVPIVLTDTAGLRDTADAVERIGVERALALAGTADVLLWLGSPAHAPEHPRLIQVRPKCDLEQSGGPGFPVSSLSGAGIPELLAEVSRLVRTVVPGDDALAINRRQADHLTTAASALKRAAGAADIVLVAEELRAVRMAFDSLTGRAGVEDVLDALFGRFCLGK